MGVLVIAPDFSTKQVVGSLLRIAESATKHLLAGRKSEQQLLIRLTNYDWKTLENTAAVAGWKEARKHDVAVPVSDAVSLAVVQALRERMESWGQL